MSGLRVIADVGGTNARFAVAEKGAYSDLSHVEVSHFASLQDALATYLDKLPPTRRPTEAAVAVAAPVFGDKVSLTNHGWSFSIEELKRNLGLTSLRVVNDFAATAMAVPHLPEKDVFLVGPECPHAQGPIGILGPGTGLGVCTLIPQAGRWTIVPGEGGHVTLPTSTALEDQIAAYLRTRWPHVSAERVLSGSGLVNLYQALCFIDGSTAREFSPADVTDHAIKKTDGTCVRAFECFCAFLGTVAGDLALTIGATGGVYIAGGILLRFREAFASSAFRERFESKGRFQHFLSAIPTRLVLEESPALLGLANIPSASG
ncbi:glucokinase [Bradyrhizobium sp. SYSU BS000235]|uniref:glucokinase n=1 Tax=Bradyrhizobium sp. SYSU BS000235 TaxID=3411332 RepID=UPI003C756AE1